MTLRTKVLLLLTVLLTVLTARIGYATSNPDTCTVSVDWALISGLRRCTAAESMFIRNSEAVTLPPVTVTDEDIANTEPVDEFLTPSEYSRLTGGSSHAMPYDEFMANVRAYGYPCGGDSDTPLFGPECEG